MHSIRRSDDGSKTADAGKARENEKMMVNALLPTCFSAIWATVFDMVRAEFAPTICAVHL
jgi:hypothetical protein